MYDIVKEEEHDAAAVVHCDVWNHCEVWNNISIVETSRSELIDKTCTIHYLSTIDRDTMLLSIRFTLQMLDKITKTPRR